MELNQKTIPKIPLEYVGKDLIGNGISKTTTRRWTKEEEQWCADLKLKGYSPEEIAFSVDRSIPSVSIKLKRLTKKDNSYNSEHYEDKINTNKQFVEMLNPKSILDLYCGAGNNYKEYNSTKNDIDLKYEATYHMDALKLLCKLYQEDSKFDFIDLDPFGSAYDCFDLAIKMANKGIAITFGELGHKRFKRLDFVRHHYGITSIEDFTIENIIKQVQEIGMRNKKTLKVWKIKRWKNIGRVYFVISQYKILEQWEEKNDRKSKSEPSG